MQVRENLGTVLVSMSYSPESQKLSIIILRAKDLNRGVAKAIGKSTSYTVTVLLVMCCTCPHRPSGQSEGGSW